MFNRKEYMKIYRKKYYQKQLLLNKIWRKNNPEYDKDYYQKNKEKRLLRSKEWFKNNLEYWKAYCKEWKINNPEKDRQWRENNLDKIKRNLTKYNKSEKGRANNQRRHIKRQARMKNIINTLTSQEWLDILKEYDYKCAYCGVEFNEDILPTRDHVIPISKGGNNTKENVVPACKGCNCKKHDKINYHHVV